MDRAKIVEFYLEKINKDFDLFDARKEMEKNKVDEEEIKIIIRLLDSELRRETVTQSNDEKSGTIIWIGLILTAIGAGVTLGTYFGLMNTGNYYIIAYGPFLAGLSILLTGIGLRRK